MAKSSIRRREFLKRAGASALGIAAASKYSIMPSNVLGANEKIVCAAIGIGRQGESNMGDFMRNPEVEMAAVCDVYKPHLQRGVERTDGKADAYSDFRRIIERKDIDVVIVSTPDHWHPLIAIYACESGKDVYVEKPLSQNIVEGRRMVEYARRYNRVVQVGTQQRSGEHFLRAAELVRSGKLGKISFVRTWNYGNSFPNGIGREPDTAPPPDLDWNMWLGPAPDVQYNLLRWRKPGSWGTFRYFWDYSGGMVTDWATHLIDIVHWAMDVDAPCAVSAHGRKFLDDAKDTPDMIEIVYEYPGFFMTYTYDDLNSHGLENKGYGIMFHGTNGTLFVDRSGYNVIPEMRGADGHRVGKMDIIESGGSDQHFPHVRNFLDCVKSRKLPISDVEAGHRSTSASILGNIAFRSKETLEWDGKNERVTNHEKPNDFLFREYRAPWHLPG